MALYTIQRYSKYCNFRFKNSVWVTLPLTFQLILAINFLNPLKMHVNFQIIRVKGQVSILWKVETLTNRICYDMKSLLQTCFLELINQMLDYCILRRRYHNFVNFTLWKFFRNLTRTTFLHEHWIFSIFYYSKIQ